MYLSLSLTPSRVIVEAESVTDWSAKVTEIKRSFLQLKENLYSIRGESKPLQYPHINYYTLHHTLHVHAAGTKISSAAEGNLLEAVNLAINGNVMPYHRSHINSRVYLPLFSISVFDKGYIDCNFMLTGQQIAIVTAGVGVFEVNKCTIRIWFMCHVMIV